MLDTICRPVLLVPGHLHHGRVGWCVGRVDADLRGRALADVVRRLVPGHRALQHRLRVRRPAVDAVLAVVPRVVVVAVADAKRLLEDPVRVVAADAVSAAAFGAVGQGAVWVVDAGVEGGGGGGVGECGGEGGAEVDQDAEGSQGSHCRRMREGAASFGTRVWTWPGNCGVCIVGRSSDR